MLARLYGKSDIYNFKIEIFGDIKTFDFLNVYHHENGAVLTQVINITRDSERLIGDCKVIGFRESGVLKNIRTPFMNDAKIESAGDDFIEKTVGLTTDDNSFIGVLEHHPNLRISLDLKKTITKHIAILAKSGAGKSYTVGVILEEVIKKNIPIVILDPHNEYSSIKYPNTDKKDMKRLDKFNLTPQGFLERVKEYSPDITTNPQCEPITLDINTLKPQDLIESLPQKLSPAQQGLIFNILSNLNNRINFDELIFNISNEDSNSKWSLITLLEQLKKLKIYSSNPTPLQEIVKYKKISIISLKGVEPYVQETFVAGLLKELYEGRKKEEIPPFLLVLEEGHNFCPERSFGELKTSKIIRTIAGEGRKFGIGLCVISQRPAKIDKNVVSQCSTQVLLKITNPNDLKSVISSSEGVDSTSENEIQKLNIGTCLLTGVIDIPLKVNIRPRITKHGGETVDITLPYEIEDGKSVQNSDDNNISYGGNSEYISQEQNYNSNSQLESKKTFYKGKNTEFVQFVAPEIDPDDAKVMLEAEQIEVQLVPAVIVKIKLNSGKDVNLLVEKVTKKIIKTLFPYGGSDMNVDFEKLSDTEKKLIPIILTLNERFNPAELLLKTDIMFNEILRVCDSLSNKGILKKMDREFEIGNGMMFSKKLDELNFFGNQRFEEISYDTKINEVVSEENIRNTLSMFGNIENMKSIYILKYVGK